VLANFVATRQPVFHFYVASPTHTQRAHGCKQTSYATLFVRESACLCVWQNRAKTAEPTEKQFGVWTFVI